ncbi:DUF4145 domain-containing protein [Archangium minus]|uniref:DUF4145 domain-containing protein n=1 Tax=Archangium minus TaxID=83450 RepID=A0ABY9X126_9BACT|nr:DUF4145 domain-containing protein [Archangium minus]
MQPCEVCFNRDLWLATFTSYSTPPWPCPVCAAGTLALEKDTLLTRESFESKKDREPYPEIWDYDWTYGHFTALFQCTHADCLSSVTACGDYRVTREDDEEVGERYDYVCTPTHFNPAPPMLRLPRGCTDAIANELTLAWGLYWSDPGASVNHIRTSLERLMDYLAIPPLSKLHHRIEAYRHKEPELGEHLMAIKWLGNSGSHGDDGLTKEDVLDALPLLEHVLGEVFEMRSKELNRLREKLLEKHDPKRAKKAPEVGA